MFISRLFDKYNIKTMRYGIALKRSICQTTRFRSFSHCPWIHVIEEARYTFKGPFRAWYEGLSAKPCQRAGVIIWLTPKLDSEADTGQRFVIEGPFRANIVSFRPIGVPSFKIHTQNL